MIAATMPMPGHRVWCRPSCPARPGPEGVHVSEWARADGGATLLRVRIVASGTTVRAQLAVGSAARHIIGIGQLTVLADAVDQWLRDDLDRGGAR